MTFNYIWTNHFFKINEGCAFVGTKNQTTTSKVSYNHNFECLYSLFANHHIRVVLQPNICHIGTKFMHKSKHTQFLLRSWFIVHHQNCHLRWFQWSTTFLTLICGQVEWTIVASLKRVPIRKWFFLQHPITVIVTQICQGKWTKVNYLKPAWDSLISFAPL